MSEFNITSIGQRTPIHSAATDFFDLKTPKSPLLKESVGQNIFLAISRSTPLDGESWFSEFQSTGPDTGWWFTKNAQVSRPRVNLPRAKNEMQEHTPLERATSDRITLLARKYVVKESFSAEEKARLAIVTERARVLVPAVTMTQKESLDEVIQQIKQIADSDKQIRDLLGV